MRQVLALFCLATCTSIAAANEYPPKTGTDRESPAYFAAAEDFLNALDLDGPAITFKRLGGTTATNWEVFNDGVPVANLKCSSGNTNHHGAVVAYRLGRYLDFNIYPVAVHRNVNREIDGRSVQGECALKSWSSVFTQYYWTRDTFTSTDDSSKRALVAALDCRNPQPSASEPYTYSANSAYGNPKLGGVKRVPYRGTTNLLAAARDFSTMMLVDTLIGNEDRFPGGNTFFRSVTTTHSDDGSTVTFDRVRLYSLDNEAAFKGAGPGSAHSATDLKTHVFRFDPAIVAKLRTLAEDERALLEIADASSANAAFIRDAIHLVLEQVARSDERCAAGTEFFPR